MKNGVEKTAPAGYAVIVYILYAERDGLLAGRSRFDYRQSHVTASRPFVIPTKTSIQWVQGGLFP